MQPDFNAPAGSEALANPGAATASEPTAQRRISRAETNLGWTSRSSLRPGRELPDS